MFKNYDVWSFLWVIRFGTIKKPNSRQMVDNWYTFFNINNIFDINFWHTAYTIASKIGTHFGKKRNLLQSNGYVHTFKGDH